MQCFISNFVKLFAHFFSPFTKPSLLYNSLEKASSLNFPRNFECMYRRCIKMWYVVCGNYERLLLATYHGLARAFRCQLFIGVRRLELEIREIHGQDAALVKAECAQSDVVPAVLLKYERNVSVSEDKCRGRILFPEWEGRPEGSFLRKETGLAKRSDESRADIPRLSFLRVSGKFFQGRTAPPRSCELVMTHDRARSQFLQDYVSRFVLSTAAGGYITESVRLIIS